MNTTTNIPPVPMLCEHLGKLPEGMELIESYHDGSCKLKKGNYTLELKPIVRSLWRSSFNEDGSVNYNVKSHDEFQYYRSSGMIKILDIQLERSVASDEDYHDAIPRQIKEFSKYPTEEEEKKAPSITGLIAKMKQNHDIRNYLNINGISGHIKQYAYQPCVVTYAGTETILAGIYKAVRDYHGFVIVTTKYFTSNIGRISVKEALELIDKIKQSKVTYLNLSKEHEKMIVTKMI